MANLSFNGLVESVEGETLAETARSVGMDPPISVRTLHNTIEQLERRSPVEVAIDAFDASDHAAAWSEIDRATVIDQLQSRVAEPWQVDQGPAPLCGPSVVVYDLARRDPEAYVRLVRDLFERGRATVPHGARIAASAGLRGTPPHGITAEDGHRWQVPEVDWLVTAALRESQNLLFDISDLEGLGAFKGATTPWEIVGWAKKLLGYRNVRFERAKAFGELGVDPGVLDNILGAGIDEVVELLSAGELSAKEVMRESIEAVQRGGAAFWMLNASVLNEPARLGILGELVPNIATHWVALVHHESGLRRMNNGSASNEVAVDARDDEGNVTGWAAPMINIDHEGIARVTMFTWSRVESLRVPMATLRRHLFLAVTAW
jgi:hypothetical protein